MEIIEKQSDVLIIGGGAAGLFAAIRLAETHPELSILIVEKANIVRSGCLAAGVNALNAYITDGHTPDDYVEYALNDANGIARRDLLSTMSERLNAVTRKIESLGLVILKDADGNYIARGARNIKINGENIKPLLAAAVKSFSNVEVLNHVNVVDLMLNGSTVIGAWGFDVREPTIYRLRAKATLMATGGAAGLYRPNHPGFSRHVMWYCPFNTGAGYAMGIRAGAEMTTFEMRFIALRCKDTIAPTGTLAQGAGAAQINARGERYQHRYGNTTSERLHAVVSENLNGRGPCALETIGITVEQEKALEHAYLNMAPAQTLKWLETKMPPSIANVEIEGSEPYVVGGHTASGYWIDRKRRTTLRGLYAAGDVAGSCPQKYVTGAFAEGEIAAESIAEYVAAHDLLPLDRFNAVEEVERLFGNPRGLYSTDELEEAMQQSMDEYAGGIRSNYRYTDAQLQTATAHIDRLERLSEGLRAESMYDLLKIYELRERLTVCRVLIEHLKARRETRWHCFAEHADYPDRDPTFDCFINSRLVDGKVEIILRRLEDDGIEEH
ncbi:MAG: adenylyl-sulfate reductase subunit alpha [Selenomonadaceae bacterium]|nr:adenylyl-sulfate reductase subunit alpha [Selenomonadaceae bacterium]